MHVELIRGLWEMILHNCRHHFLQLHYVDEFHEARDFV